MDFTVTESGNTVTLAFGCHTLECCYTENDLNGGITGKFYSYNNESVPDDMKAPQHAVVKAALTELLSSHRLPPSRESLEKLLLSKYPVNNAEVEDAGYAVTHRSFTSLI